MSLLNKSGQSFLDHSMRVDDIVGQVASKNQEVDEALGMGCRPVNPLPATLALAISLCIGRLAGAPACSAG
jgi:hypothetical protein